MSTPDPKLPLELQLASASPSHLDTGRSPATSASPGVTTAPLRHPASPTLPDFDAATLTRVVQMVANDLFQAPPVPPASAPPASSSTQTPGSHAPAHSGEIPAVAGDEGPTMPQPASAFSTSLPGSITPSAPSPVKAPLARDITPPAASSTTTPAGDFPPVSGGQGGLGSANPFAAAPSFDSLFAPAAGFDFQVPLLDGEPPAPTTGETPAAPAPAPAPSGTPTGWEHNPVVDLGLKSSSGGGFDAYALREEFPILKERVHGGKRLVWLDNAATTQKPQTVIDRLSYFYEHENSNIHRAAHTLAARASEAYEQARESVRRFINAGSVKEIVFVRGTTEGINFIAQSYGRQNIQAGDEIVITHLEHHANIVPWQLLVKETGAKLRLAPVDDSGQILLDDFQRLLSKKTKLVSLPAVSNALGTVTPAKAMIAMAHRVGAVVVLDAAQSVSHMAVDVQDLDPDFLVFSGHKVFAPTGIGAVYGKQAILDDMPPWQGGGNMIADVTFEKTVYQPAPARFEAGTGNIADAVGMGAALDWLTRVGLPNVERHEHDLLVYGTEQLLRVPGLTMIGTAKEKAGVLSFTIAGHATQDISAYLDKEGVAVRGGHHCAQPILRRMGVESTVRASLAPYNVKEDIDVMVDALWRMPGVTR